jgi:hypothetical protein
MHFAGPFGVLGNLLLLLNAGHSGAPARPSRDRRSWLYPAKNSGSSYMFCGMLYPSSSLISAPSPA